MLFRSAHRFLPLWGAEGHACSQTEVNGKSSALGRTLAGFEVQRGASLVEESPLYACTPHTPPSQRKLDSGQPFGVSTGAREPSIIRSIQPVAGKARATVSEQLCHVLLALGLRLHITPIGRVPNPAVLRFRALLKNRYGF